MIFSTSEEKDLRRKMQAKPRDREGAWTTSTREQVCPPSRRGQRKGNQGEVVPRRGGAPRRRAFGKGWETVNHKV